MEGLRASTVVNREENPSSPSNENQSHEAYSEVSQTWTVFCRMPHGKLPSSKQDEWSAIVPIFSYFGWAITFLFGVLELDRLLKTYRTGS